MGGVVRDMGVEVPPAGRRLFVRHGKRRVDGLGDLPVVPLGWGKREVRASSVEDEENRENSMDALG